MSEGSPVYSDTIRLNIETPQNAGAGLAELVKQLGAVHSHIQKINAELNGMNLGPAVARSQKALEAEIKSLQTGTAVKGGNILGLSDLSKQLNLNLDQFRAHLARVKDLKNQYAVTTETFLSVPAAARQVHAFEASLIKQGKNVRKSLGDLLTPSVAAVHGVSASAGGITAKVEGQIPLSIPAAQVQASVIGTVTLAVPGGQVGGATRNEKGQFVSTGGGSEGDGGGGRGKKKGAGLTYRVPPQAGEFRRERVEDLLNDTVKETVTYADALGQTVSDTYDSVEKAVAKRVKKRATGQSPLARFRTARQVEEEAFKAAKAGITDKLGLAAQQEKQADVVKNLLKSVPGLPESLGKTETARVQSLLDARHRTLMAEAAKSRREHAEALRKEAEKKAADDIKEQTREVQFQKENSARRLSNQRTALQSAYSDTFRTGRGPFFSEMAKLHEERARHLEETLQKNPGIPARQHAALLTEIESARANAALFSRQAGGDGPNTPTGEKARFLSGLKGFTPMGMAANLTKVAGWATAVTILYKSVELARYSMERFLDIGMQTARLEQVFKGVGGSARELTDDVMKLAVANARDTSEAMDSAIEWSRLGLSRRGVNEAVRVSAMAATVAHMRMGETTKQLSTLMHVYGLEAGDLNGVLGMLTSTSQRYNVTLEDLFTGLDRSAAVARHSGMGFAELQGLIGATVGRSGQSGIIVGNTIKSILTQFGNPAMQGILRGYGIETLTSEGQQQNGSEILRRMYVAWQGLDPRRQQALTVSLAGRQQSARFMVMMDNYLTAQKLAIDSQLTGAEGANTRLTGTGLAEWKRVKAEWDRVAVSGGEFMGNAFGPLIRGALHIGGAAMDAVSNGANWINYHWMDLPQYGPRAPFNPIQEHHANASRESLKARLFQTVSEALPKARDAASVKQMVEVASSEMDETTAAAFRQTVEARNMGAAQQLLAQAGSGATARSKAELAAELEARKKEQAQKAQRVAEAQAELAAAKPYGEVEAAQERYDRARVDLAARFDEAQKAGHGSGTFWGLGTIPKKEKDAWQAAKVEKEAAEEELNRLKDQWARSGQEQTPGRFAETKKKLAEAQDAEKQAAEQALQAVEALNQAEGDTPEVLARKQEFLNLLKQQEMLMQSIAQLAEQGNMDTMGGKVDTQVGALRQQIEMLQAQENTLRERGDTEGVKAADEMRQQLEELRARAAALESPRMRELARVYDERQIALGRASDEARSYGVGSTESSKLLNEERALQSQLAALRRKEAGGSLNSNDAVRAKELEVALWHTQEQIQSRIIDLARQEKQIRLDAQREFNKGLLLAGPGELLQRLHTSQLMRRPQGLSAGEFFAMSPENRRMYFEAMGGEAGMLNRMEQRQMRGHQWSVGQEQEAGRAAQSNVEHWNSALRRWTTGAMNGQPAMPLPPLPPLNLEMMARNVASLGSASLNTAGAMNRLFAAVDKLTDRINGIREPKSHEAPGRKVDLHPPYSLGAGTV